MRVWYSIIPAIASDWSTGDRRPKRKQSAHAALTDTDMHNVLANDPPGPRASPNKPAPSNAAVQSHGRTTAAEEVARPFTRAPAAKVADLLETLATLGQVRVAGEEPSVA